MIISLILRIKELSEAQPLSEKKISSDLLHKRKGLALIPAGYLFQFKLTLKGLYLFHNKAYDESLKIYTKSIQLNKNSSNALRCSALKKIEKILRIKNLAIESQKFHKMLTHKKNKVQDKANQ